MKKVFALIIAVALVMGLATVGAAAADSTIPAVRLDSGKIEATFLVTYTMTVGDTQKVQLFLDSGSTEVKNATFTINLANNAEGKVTVTNPSKASGESAYSVTITAVDVIKRTDFWVYAYVDGLRVAGGLVQVVVNAATDDPGTTPGGDDDPGGDTPGGDTPGGNTPGGNAPSGNTPGSSSESSESSTDNAANSEATISVIEDAIVALATGAELPASAVTATTAAGTTVTAIPVKLTSGSANILTETASLVGTGRAALDISVDNGAMEVLLPGGFGAINEPGRIYYPFNFVSNPTLGGTMRLFVKEKDAESETVKAGGNMTLPTTATVTLKTKLTGKVNIYYYNEETGRFTKLATVTPKDGKLTFATKQMGHMLITTGTI